MKLELFVTIVLLSHHVHARAVRRSCGKYLANRIYEICKARGGYSQLNVTPTTRTPEFSHRRVKRGVVEECCRQSCTDSTLIQYCMESAVESGESVQFDDGVEKIKPMVSFPTEKSINQIFSTKFPIRNTVPFEVGTVRPEFNKINAKYVGNRRKQYY